MSIERIAFLGKYLDITYLDFLYRGDSDCQRLFHIGISELFSPFFRTVSSIHALAAEPFFKTVMADACAFVMHIVKSNGKKIEVVNLDVFSVNASFTISGITDSTTAGFTLYIGVDTNLSLFKA